LKAKSIHYVLQACDKSGLAATRRRARASPDLSARAIDAKTHPDKNKLQNLAQKWFFFLRAMRHAALVCTNEILLIKVHS